MFIWTYNERDSQTWRLKYHKIGWNAIKRISVSISPILSLSHFMFLFRYLQTPKPLPHFGQYLHVYVALICWCEIISWTFAVQ